MTGSTKRPPVMPEPGSMPTILAMTASAVIDMEAAADGTMPGTLPRFRMVAYTGGPMRVSGWRYPVILDLAGLSIPSQARPIRFGHDPLAGVGHTDVIRVDQGQLVATGIVSRDTAAAREVVVSSKNGFPWQASVGASVEEFEFVKESQKVMVNGQQYSGPINVVRKATLGEISFVDLGADGATSAAVAAAEYSELDANPPAESEPAMTVEDTHSTEERTPDQVPGAETPSVPVEGLQVTEQIRNAAAAETDRIEAIRRICGGRSSRIEATAIREGWTEQRTELEILRNARPTAPAVHVPETVVNSTVLEAACFMAGRIDNLESRYDARTLDVATSRFRGGIGLQE